MSSTDKFELPTVADSDVYHASRLLGLPDAAFYGTDGIDPRQNVLKRIDTVDVAACPGSGKTTLLVAKLAILAEKWQHSTRGICVLSHTNAARHEIEKHLGNSSIGQRLLSYPHFIGTIHGFVNDFLAIPLLRSLGYPIKMIDTEACLKRRWYYLPYNTRVALEKNHHDSSVLSVKTHDFCVGEVRWGRNGTLGTNTSTYSDIQDACRRSATDGYFCHDELFMWAEYLMDTVAGVVEVLRDRFPLLLIDEAQDNSKAQTDILKRIFLEGDNPVVRQRFGDTNQAIFDFQGAEEAATDKFPSGVKIELPNSYRFDQTIADLADPLGIQPYRLQGLGPRKSLASGPPAGKHTIFLFNENSADKVLEAYGTLLLDTFSDAELREEWFAAKAVGQRHTPQEADDNHKFPQHVGHYWSGYEAELTKLDPTPRSFMQYVFAGQGKSELKRESHAMVEKIAEGLLRLSDLGVEGRPLARRKHAHRHALQLLEPSPDIRKCYLDLVFQLTVNQEMPSLESWNTHLRDVVRSIAETLAGSRLSEEAINFLMWENASVVPPLSTNVGRSRNNHFSYRKDGREVFIQAGSIHSVKGQTHTATLVLETFWYDHNLALISPWFTGNRQGWSSRDGPRQSSRLKLHYVAMTRPTHLLCVAMKQNSLTDEQMTALRTRGWRLLQVQPDGSTKLFEPL
jgi:DNA helicase II / ATP-dependent DNA helicase PcrA